MWPESVRGTRLAASFGVAKKAFSFSLPWSAGKRQTVEETTGENGEEKNPQAQLYGFRAVYVFDISQTEGKDLPALTEVQGDVQGYRERLMKFVEAQSIELTVLRPDRPRQGSVAWRKNHPAFRDAAGRGVLHAGA